MGIFLNVFTVDLSLVHVDLSLQDGVSAVH